MAMRFTHGYDALFKVGTMFGGLVLVSAGAQLLSPIADPIERTLKSHDWGGLWSLITLAYGIGGYIGAIVLLGETVLPHWGPTYLYARFTLGTPINADEAGRLEFLFGGLGGRWYPLTSIRTIDPDYRREALFRFANKVAELYGLHRPFVMPEDRMNQSERSGPTAKPSSHDADAERDQVVPDNRIKVCLELLGLRQMPPTFDPIRQAYRRKIREFHPDKFVGERPEVLRAAEEVSKRLNAAYEFLERRFAEANA